MKTIKSKKEFEQVFSSGRRVNHRLVRATVLSDDEGDCEKVAFVAPKRLGNAVYRNRCKRILREAARSCGLPLPGTKIILFATRMTHESSPAEVSSALESIVSRVGLR